MLFLQEQYWQQQRITAWSRTRQLEPMTGDTGEHANEEVPSSNGRAAGSAGPPAGVAPTHVQQSEQPQCSSTQQPACWLITYNVSKRHNVGTLLRSATAFGVKEVCCTSEVSLCRCTRRDECNCYEYHMKRLSQRDCKVYVIFSRSRPAGVLGRFQAIQQLWKPRVRSACSIAALSNLGCLLPTFA